MNVKPRHNGCDVLMLGFDCELRRRGFAGNSCQIHLELAKPVSATQLEQRLAELVRQNPILGSRPARGFNPHWKPMRTMPQVRVHAESDDLTENSFNEPLNLQRGELIRFDLAGRTLIFTWSHALMDAKSAEYFLAVVGDDSLPLPEPEMDWYAARAKQAGNLRARIRQAWRALERMDQFKRALPISLATRRPPTTKKLQSRVVNFSSEESVRIQSRASRLGGFLGETNFHLAVALAELHQLHRRMNCPSASYVVPIAVGLRPRGTHAPLFSNQVVTVLHQFLPDQLETVESAIAAVKKQKADCLREGQIDSSLVLAQLFRALPLRLYMRLVKHELEGEICSLFFGDTGSVDSALQNFLGADITAFAHVPAVTVPPGIGVVFYHFRNQLRFTLVHAAGTLNAGEAADFANRLRERLLKP